MQTPPLSAKKLTFHFALIQFFFFASDCCFSSFAAVYLLAQGFSNTQIGFTLTFASLAAILCQPLVSTMIDRNVETPLRQIASRFALAAAGFSLLVLLVPGPALLLSLLYILLLCASASQSPATNIMAMDHVENHVPLHFGLARGVGSLSYALVSFSMGYLIQAFGASVIVLTSTLFWLITFLLLRSFPIAPRYLHNQAQQATSSNFWQFARRNRTFCLVAASLSLVLFSSILINTYMIHIITRAGGGKPEMGTAIALSALLELPAMALFPLFLKWARGPAALLKFSAFVFLIKAIVMSLSTTMSGVYAAQCLQFLSFGIFTPASIYYAGKAVLPADRVKGQACLGIMYGVGAMVANSVGGVILDYGGGLSAMFWTGIAVTFAGFLLLCLFAKEAPGQNEAPAP